MKNKELCLRTITVFTIGIMTVAVILHSGNPYILKICSAFLSCVAVYELLKAADISNRNVMFGIFGLCAILLSFITIPYYFQILLIVFPLTCLIYFYLMKNRESVSLKKEWAVIVLILLEIFLFQAIHEIRFIENGLYYLIFGILVCVCTDIFAYICGKLFGKHKLVPVISPKKTWEGSLGGMFFAILFITIGAVFANRYEGLSINYAVLIMFTVVVSIVAQFGDLSMSIIKRICGIKDFGTIFPGHGGVLDRFDSQLFAIPLVLILASFTGFIS